MFDNLTKSDHAAAIFYADLFRINGRVWMIMGYGKSKAGTIAAENADTNHLAEDCVAIKVENGKLYGRYDPGAIRVDLVDQLNPFHRIHHVAYCLSPLQTDDMFENSEKFIVDTELDLMASLAVMHRYPVIFQNLYGEKEFSQLADTDNRTRIFRQLLNCAHNTNLHLIPFMESTTEKAKLYKDYSRVYGRQTDEQSG